MGANEECSWDEKKRRTNRANHGYDFADVIEVFDGRFAFTRQDTRFDYGELRYNMLVAFKERIINVTFSPRMGRVHLISARPASREERKVYHAQHQKNA